MMVSLRVKLMNVKILILIFKKLLNLKYCMKNVIYKTIKNTFLYFILFKELAGPVLLVLPEALGSSSFFY